MIVLYVITACFILNYNSSDQAPALDRLYLVFITVHFLVNLILLKADGILTKTKIFATLLEIAMIYGFIALVFGGWGQPGQKFFC